jgi:putative transcriptional regulator
MRAPYEENFMITGEEIKELRKLLGYTQAKLAEEVGVTPNTVARYERDEFRPSSPVQKLLKMLQLRETDRKAA